VPKFFENSLVNESSTLVPSAKDIHDWKKTPPGIRAQLVHLPTGELVQDFILKKQANSTHVLNAVSPGWTCAIPFGRQISEML
jgi:L-2-hydroxyglutarate oxidase LhgO